MISITHQASSNVFSAPALTITDARDDVASSAGGPKTCARCGRQMENNESTETADSAVHAVPSPSSVAFAAEASTSAQISSILAGSSSSGSESMALDEDGHQICSLCATNSRISESSGIRDNLAIRTTDRRTRSGTIQRHDQVVQEEEGDTVMAVNQAEVEPDIAENSVETTPSRARDTAAAAAAHPWRRAPWARTQADSGRGSADSGQAPLSISMADIGAGGDAEMAVGDDDDQFPPLPRSPQTALSPRFPTSPTRTRSAVSPPTTPSSTARRTSFSRSQTGPTASAIHTSPIVNLSMRGRNRDGSIGSSTGGGAAAAATPPLLARRPSSHRRLSRSNSSQGPTTIAFAEGVKAAAAAEGLTIIEDLFGPSSMTRPRLSTLTPLEMASSGVSNIALTDLYDRKSGPQHHGIEETEEQAKQRLTWFRYNHPDPRRDMSKLRCTSRGRGCLFPGATFNGTQKSGRMSYDVTVQIVNVDMASSHLCGYLNIRGLTDDWPELTTYFDAEIIGMRYGFLTGKWGAQEADDMKHWSRFAPFRPLKNSLIKPGLRFNQMNKPFVFMRWKERFLVPDHRVRDINGASFAGFYYVCVELGEDEAGKSALTAPLSPTFGDAASPPILPHHQVRTRSASNRRRSNSTYVAPPTATSEQRPAEASAAGPEAEAAAVDAAPHVVTMGRMSGFYFHEHSEPYQQLTLQHVTERSSSTFELR